MHNVKLWAQTWASSGRDFGCAVVLLRLREKAMMSFPMPKPQFAIAMIRAVCLWKMLFNRGQDPCFGSHAMWRFRQNSWPARYLEFLKLLVAYDNDSSITSLRGEANFTHLIRRSKGHPTVKAEPVSKPRRLGLLIQSYLSRQQFSHCSGQQVSPFPVLQCKVKRHLNHGRIFGYRRRTGHKNWP